MVAEPLGPSLADFVVRAGRRVGPRFVAGVLRDLLTCLRFLKDCGVVHARLRPDNVLLRSEKSGRVKLIDFAGAFFADQAAHKDPNSIPLACRPPEAILGLRLTDAVDMWGLGCTLYELVALRPLFPYESPQEVMGKMLALSQRFSLASVPDSKEKRAMLMHGSLLFQQRENNRLAVIVPKLCAPLQEEIQRHVADVQLAEFIAGCLEFNPSHRLTVEQALNHAFLKKFQ